MSLSALADLISSSVRTIELAVAESAKSQKLQRASSKSHSVTPHEVLEAVDLIVAACAELTSKVQDSAGFICKHALGFNVSSAIRVAVEAHLPEILKPHGSQGLDVQEIARRCDANPNRIERIMRLLVSHHIFTSPSKGRFANNRHSLALDTGKPAEELTRELVSEKYMGSNTLPALITHSTDEMFKSSSHLTECILEPSSSRLFFGDQSPFSHAFETGMDYKTFLQLSFDQEVRLRRFITATECLSRIGASDQGLSGYNWSTLGNGLLVDISGGVGHAALTLAKSYPNLKIVLQDRPEVILQAGAFWQKHFPQAVLSKRVILETHNVFDAQKRKGPRIFFVRFVIREWNDEEAVKILTNLSQASSPSTKLILVERTVTNYSHQSAEDCPLQSWEILKDVRVPKYVQSSFCHGNHFPQVLEETGRPLINLLDAQLMLYGSGRERTLEELISMLDESNWQVEKISRPGTSSLTQIICKPIAKTDDEVGGWEKKPNLAASLTAGGTGADSRQDARSPKKGLSASILGRFETEVIEMEKEKSASSTKTGMNNNSESKTNSDEADPDSKTYLKLI
ncbi:S-adenosyl-L-methionine-dependent methyltransferase [Phakopsora pachyrhizi]|uniref:S-adenosyl-L-methionine-dependent methyltransferase n=1 Tax=Phakopsora pachyrhizi TaxID=170000 RepID=A0AAV0BAI6_PHAPC|nr:S-adenosyl-L-methionine-dependent methyltransferase [Phakopsora pachyrhizi]